MSWDEANPGRHDDWCRSDLGSSDWKHTGRCSCGCSQGNAKGLCSIQLARIKRYANVRELIMQTDG